MARESGKPRNILTLPANAGLTMVRAGALMACPLLGTEKFIKFCKERHLSIDRDRLITLERLGLCAPIFRVRIPPRARRRFTLPPTKENDWFKRKWAWDTTAVPQSHAIPDPKDRTQEGYYSIFQIDHLGLILNGMSLSVSMDGFLEAAKTREIKERKSVV